MNDYYLYEHWRPDTGKCFYVGKGRKRRAWDMAKRNFVHKAITSKLTSLGLAVDVRIITTGMSNAEAGAAEIARLKLYNRNRLANLTDGGAGPSGRVLSEEARRRISEAQKGRVRTPEFRAKVAAQRTGSTHTVETRAKIAANSKGRRHSEASKTKLSTAHKGIPKSIVHRAALKLAWVNRRVKGLGCHSAETRAKMHASHQKRRQSSRG